MFRTSPCTNRTSCVGPRMTMSSPEIPSYVLYGETYGSPFPDCLHCETISDRSRVHDWHIRPHRHYGLHQFLWIAKGSVVASADSFQHVITAPAAIMNAPTAVHGFEFEPDTEGYVVTIPTVNLERSLPGPTALLSRLDHAIILQCDDLEGSPSGLSSIFASIAEEYLNREEGRVEALLCQAGLLALWFLRSASRQEVNSRSEGQPQIALVRSFLALVEENFRGQPPTLILRARTWHHDHTSQSHLPPSVWALGPGDH